MDGMNITLRIFVILISTAVFIGVIRMLVKHQLSESMSAFWLFIACMILAMGIFPSVLDKTANLLKIDQPPNLLFLISTILLLLITFKQSVQISRAELRLYETTITLSILKEEHKRLTSKIESLYNENETENIKDGVALYENFGGGEQLRDSENNRQPVKAGKA